MEGKKRGRPALPAPQKSAVEFTDEGEAALAARDTMHAVDSEREALFEVVSRVSSAATSAYFKSVATVAEIGAIKQIKDSGKYKRLVGEYPRGDGLPPMKLDGTWETFCKQATGRGVTYWDERFAAVDEIGFELVERLTAAGFGTNNFRTLAGVDATEIERLKEIEDPRTLRRIAVEIAADNKAKERIADEQRDRADKESAKADAMAEKNKALSDELAAVKKRRNAMSEEELAAHDMCQEHGEYSSAVNAAVMKMDALWTRAVESGAVNKPQTYDSLRRDVALAKMALDAMVERHEIDLTLEQPPEDIFAAGSAPTSSAIN